MNTKLITRAEAKKAGLVRYFTGRACKKGHVCERKVNFGGCVECLRSAIASWRANNKEQIKISHKAWSLNNKDRIATKHRNWYKATLPRQLFKSAQKRAKLQGITFSITVQDITVPKKCPVLGLTLKVSKRVASKNSPTLDRIVPCKGYVKGNIAVISELANRLKGFATAAQHRQIANWIESCAK